MIAQIPVYAHSEDGLYGPAIDNNFESNKWVYLYYSPLTMEGASESGKPYPAQTPPGNAPTVGRRPGHVRRLARLLPALALQVRRGGGLGAARTSTSTPSRRS